MKKTVLIAGRERQGLEFYRNQMLNLFSESMEVHLLTVDEPLDSPLVADILIVQSIEILRAIHPFVADTVPVVFAGRTISRKGFNALIGLSGKGQVLLVDETKILAEGIITVLYKAGIRGIDFVPGTSADIKSFEGSDVVVLGRFDEASTTDRRIHSVGPGYLDASTLINVGELLGLDSVISKQNIETGTDEIVPSNIGLSEIIKKANSFESQFEILLDATGAGIIAVDVNGIIRTFNPNAERATGVSVEKALSSSGVALFQEIPFMQVMKSKRPIKDQLVKIDNYDIIVSTDPIIHSQKIYGAIATVRKFNDEELKQHKFRAQIIGKGHAAKYDFSKIIGDSSAITKAISMAGRMAESNSTVLIIGESGTGKELFAQAIHNSSSRKNYPFVAVNCGAIPENLLESELFGYEEGAFTGARKGGKPGLFELAHKGTLFLDEIGEMPQHLQMRLLRVLQEREVMRVGGDRLIHIDIRLIAATNKDLKGMAEKGQFREDLYYRLNVLQLKIPPLRNRREDILTLFEAFKKEFGGDFTLTPEAQQQILENPWRGNVREIKNCVEYLVNIGLERVAVSDLPFETEHSVPHSSPEPEARDAAPVGTGREMEVKRMTFILKLLENSEKTRERLGRRSISEAARIAGIYLSEFETRTLLNQLEEQGLVEIRKGRGGTIITDTGRKVLADYQK